jgi:hypothetical protein
MLLRLLPLLAALLVLPAQPLGTHVAVPGEASVAAHERNAPLSRVGDLVTRKNRYAASLEEYFAIDDDPDQHGRRLHAVAHAPAVASVFVGRSYPPADHEPRPVHRGRAHPSTGPPHA